MFFEKKVTYSLRSKTSDKILDQKPSILYIVVNSLNNVILLFASY